MLILLDQRATNQQIQQAAEDLDGYVKMEHLGTKAILLDMTTDLSRVGNFTLQGKEKRALQFTNKLEEAVGILEKRVVPGNIGFFVQKVSELITKLKQEKTKDMELLAEDAFTYGNILSRRASRL